VKVQFWGEGWSIANDKTGQDWTVPQFGVHLCIDLKCSLCNFLSVSTNLFDIQQNVFAEKGFTPFFLALMISMELCYLKADACFDVLLKILLSHKESELKSS
jgi:hypothetical protein